jgi:hypothetical protein
MMALTPLIMTTQKRCPSSAGILVINIPPITAAKATQKPEAVMRTLDCLLTAQQNLQLTWQTLPLLTSLLTNEAERNGTSRDSLPQYRCDLARKR